MARVLRGDCKAEARLCHHFGAFPDPPPTEAEAVALPAAPFVLGAHLSCRAAGQASGRPCRVEQVCGGAVSSLRLRLGLAVLSSVSRGLRTCLLERQFQHLPSGLSVVSLAKV